MNLQRINTTASSSTKTHTIDPSPLLVEKKDVQANMFPEDDTSMLIEEVEGIWNEIFGANLFPYEQLLEMDQWKEEFLNKHAINMSSNEGREKASLALLILYKNHLLPLQIYSTNPFDKTKIDNLICILKLIMGFTLPVGEEVESFIKRNLTYSDEKSTPIIEWEVETLIKMTSIYEEQTEQLYELANQNRELIVEKFSLLKEHSASICEEIKSQSQPIFLKLNGLQNKLDQRLQKSAEQDEVLKIQAQDLKDLRTQRLQLLNKLNQITK